MAINSIFANNLADAKVYYDLVTNLIKQTKKGSVIPFYYYVPQEFIEHERLNANSQERMPSSEIFNESSHLWTQAVWIICQLLGKDFLKCIQFFRAFRFYKKYFDLLFKLKNACSSKNWTRSVAICSRPRDLDNLSGILHLK